MTAWAAVAAVLAGGVAAVIRYGVTLAFAGRFLPWAVLVVNVVGSALGGAVVALSSMGGMDAGLRLVVLGGVAGGLTTFSTWSVETVQLARSGRYWIAVGNVAVNLAAGLTAASVAWNVTTAILLFPMGRA
ncbi:CrcB protein [Diaminobutyricimonas aerilata]|uniref:Fluoride-specific ion channel FluC n=1 Tax=Diaminobutyricimonas aerilata TaxID=1162967 RepID=A0A2M9CNN1_9MICO|nr:CrcB family protein [Diaminobutyricimonas aerilata]PJJ73464.1 CrcB protein [Diaminobutyricimonas aerilata]